MSSTTSIIIRLILKIVWAHNHNPQTEEVFSVYFVIKSCADAQKWYANKIGRTFFAYKEDEDGLWVRDENGYSNVVDRKDADEIIKRN